MTILGYALVDTHVLIAADTGLLNVVTNAADGFVPSSVSPIHKIHRVGDRLLAWALTGNVGDIARFASWIDTASFDSWDDLAAGAGEKVAALAVDTRRRAVETDPDTKPSDVAVSQILLGGRVGDRLDVAIISDDGDPVMAGPAGMPGGVVGPFGPTAAVAWGAALTFNPGLSLAHPQTMRRFLESFCKSIPGLSAPVDTCKITSEKWELVEPPGGAR
jgi:hypothetical protein